MPLVGRSDGVLGVPQHKGGAGETSFVNLKESSSLFFLWTFFYIEFFDTTSEQIKKQSFFFKS